MHTKSKFLLTGAVVAGILLIGCADRLTGRDMNFFLFYFFPISITAWYIGIRTAVTLSIMSALIWFVAIDFHNPAPHSQFVSVWNSGIRLGAFTFVAFAVFQIRLLLEQEKAAAAALRQALSEIKILEGILPICAQCKKIRNTEDNWVQMEAYISKHSGAVFSHGFCPECAKKFMEEVGLTDADIRGRSGRTKA